MGLDGCRGGWVAAKLVGERIEFDTFPDVSAMAEWRREHAPPAIVAIDVPIGLTDDGGPRSCDSMARARLGPASGSVFAPPARYLLAATDYKHVQRLVKERQLQDGDVPGLSAQAAGLISKIAEVDEFVRSTSDVEDWLVEVHPEISFLAWNGQPLAGKKSPAGALQRLRLPRGHFAGVEDGLLALESSRVGLDDALDACAALWSAVRQVNGEAETLGGDRDANGLIMRMVV
jgi:predicted RNase H-like nuclease